MQHAVTSSVPEFDVQWGVPVSSAVLRSADFKRVSLSNARSAILELTGIDFIEASFLDAVAAISVLEGSIHFEAARLWLLGVRYPDVASQSIEVQKELPTWFWEGVLEQVQSVTRFEALCHVGDQLFEIAIERWVNKPEGVSLSAINYWRKKRTGAWGMISEPTFLALYGS